MANISPRIPLLGHRGADVAQVIFVKIIPLPAVGAVAVLPIALGIAGAAFGVHQLLQAVVAIFKTQQVIGGGGAGAFDGYFFKFGAGRGEKIIPIAHGTNAVFGSVAACLFWGCLQLI